MFKIISGRMMALALSGLFCFAPIAVQGQVIPEIEVRASRIHGLFYMLECLVDVPRRSKASASTFVGRIGDWYPVSRALDAWREELNSDELSTLRFPRIQGYSPTLGQVLEKVALESEDVEGFIGRVGPWLGPETTYKLHRALAAIDPLYEKYWWPGSNMGGRRAELIAQLEQGDFNESFAKAARFYRGSMPTGVAPVVALIPYRKGILETATRTRGHSNGHIQVLEVVLDESKTNQAGVVFHEFCHALWKGQDLSERDRWVASFDAHGLWGRLAYAQLNEGLATALGNGWFHRKVTGELEAKPWYFDPVIDAYGRALYPIVSKCIDEERPPSNGELLEMIEAFRQVLPDADRNFDVVAAQFLTVTDRLEAHQAEYQSGLMRLGPVRSSGVRTWDNTKESRATFVVYWWEPGDVERLVAQGWSAENLARGGPVLRQTPKGWELAFKGSTEALLSYLRKLQKEGLN